MTTLTSIHMALQQYYVQLQIDGESIGNIGLEHKLLSGFIQKIATIFQGLFKEFSTSI